MTKKFANRAKNNSKKRSLVFEPLEKRNLLTTFMVNTTADSGMGSLRQAILDANDTVNNPGHDDIQFNIAGGGFRTITLSSPLPSITDEVTINGATQPGFSGSPLIQINAGFAASGSSGLSLATNNSIVRGLEISRFGTGVNVGGTSNIIAGNWIGLSGSTGNAAGGNGTGVLVTGSFNTIGGTTNADRNVVSGSTTALGTGRGISISGSQATNNIVSGNYVGLNASGTTTIGNATDGIRLQVGSSATNRLSAGNTIIGGTTAAARNVISGSGSSGNAINVFFTDDCTIRGNYVGTNAAGTVSLGTGNIGIFLVQSDNNLVGGVTPGAGNLVVGTGNNAISMQDTTQNVVQGNVVGLNASQTAAIGSVVLFGININSSNHTLVGGTIPRAANIVCNSAGGINLIGNASSINVETNDNVVQGNYVGTTPAGPITGAGNRASGGIRIGGNTVPVRNNLIGGTANGAGNVIAFNSGPGINATIGDGNTFSRNSIFSNGGLGIELSPPTGANPNDPMDPDTGTNQLQNYPVINSVVTSGGTTTVQGSLNSTPNQTFTIEFFYNQTADSSGFGEGQTFIGSTSVTTNAFGNATFSVAVPTAIPAGSVSATATDSFGNTSEFSRVVTGVVSGNSAPVAQNDAYTVDEDDTISGNVLANDTDAENNSLTASVVATPSHGTLSFNANGSFTYTPDANYFGSDSFKYKANDGQLDSNVATVNITVTSVNDAPVAGDDSASVAEDGSVTTNVVANDNAGPANENQLLTISAVTQGTNGVVTNNGDGTLTYTPNPDFFGSDSYTYTVSDSDGATATATVSVTVNSVNDAPTGASDTAVVNEDSSVTTNVVANDSAGPANETQTLTVVAVTQGTHGNVVNNNDGTVTYTPDADFFGTDSFSYTVSDSDGATATATVSVTVNSVNDAPTAASDLAIVNEDSSVTTNVVANDSAGPANENQTLTVLAVSQGAHGTVTNNGDGTVTYTPNANYFGTDGYTYTVSDSDGATSTAIVNVTINEVNDAPVAANDAAVTTQDTAVTGNVLANDSDPDNTDGVSGNEDDLDAAVVSGPTHGTLTLNSATGAFTYAPSAGYFGTDSFTYRAVDSDGATSNVATVSITIAAATPGSVYSVPDNCEPGKTALVVNGTAIDDDIQITPTSGGINVTINNVSKGTFNPTGRIIVYGYAGNDNIQLAGSVPNEAWLYGDAGNDRLNLAHAGGIAFGGDGNDQLLGGNGRDILVGGDGVDRLIGNSNDDILIASSSTYDDRFTSALHEAAWCGIFHEWTRSDHGYQQRILNIQDGTGTLARSNGTFFLNDATVFDDNDEDTLTGAAAQDWFFANLVGNGAHDKITDLQKDELEEELIV